MTTRFVGKPVIRADAREKVTGNALYIDDLRFPRMLYMKVKRSGIPHGNIIRVDTAKAESVEGVYKVLSRNTPELADKIIIGTCIFDLSPIAIDKVRHEGEIVAVVIADSEKSARTAVSKISVDIEELPFVLDPVEAAAPGAPLIHDNNGEFKHLPTFTPVPGTNIFFRYNLKKGEHQDVFKDADITVEETFSYPLVNHAAIEPHGTIARWDHSGDLHIWSSSQAPFVLREVLSEMFDLQMNRIHVHIPLLGGGFGGKSDYTIEPLVALAARFVPGYHVKFVLTREEVFYGSVLGRGMKGRMKIGAKEDGSFCGLESELFFSDGTSGDTGCNVVLAAGHNCAGPYYWPNCNIVSNGVYTNTPPVGAFRGYGHPEGQFMMERLVEKLAEKTGLDSIEIRKKNFLKPGDTNSLNQEITEHNGNIQQCFDKMIEILESNQLPEEDSEFYYGRGVAAIVKSPVQASNASSCVFLKFNEDLSVNISIGGVEMGQGCLTVLAQIAAETLMIPVHKIRINHEI
ncbi:MAG: xanthine dehydrogenase family protein molybdopterin-binding subunit, partial [Candidatus Hodarchaeales archaeon]